MAADPERSLAAAREFTILTRVEDVLKAALLKDVDAYPAANTEGSEPVKERATLKADGCCAKYRAQPGENIFANLHRG
jgi:hypothetical protein